MGRIQDAFLAGRTEQGAASAAAQEVSAFDRGAAWARDVLLPAIEAANQDLASQGVQFRVDTNLDPRSTNHAHVDFWLAPTAEQSGGSPHGLRHSINVRDGRDVWLFRHGDSGVHLGTIDKLDAAACESMLAGAAGDYGRIATR